MNTATLTSSSTSHRSYLPALIILSLVMLSTLILAGSLSSLRASSGFVGYSAPALFNEGNTAAQQGKTGQAIVDYERARLLAPNNPDIAANLQWVREHAGIAASPVSLLERTTSWASLNTMALFGWMGLILTGAGILSAQSFSQFRFGFHLAALVGMGLLILSALGASTAWQKSQEAIVISSDAPARISPVTTGETTFKLRPGELVSIQGRYNDFALVQNSIGHSGWVAQSDITPLIPRS